jgi:hypothetical protein
MKFDLQSIDQTQFMVHPHVIGGKTVYLVQPQHIGCKWTQANKHLRSSVCDHEGNLVSAGFPKFTNWGENPEHFPVPTSLKNTTVVEKLDGSLLIVSKWNGNLILRTRGTVDATALENGYELEIFREKFLNSIAHDTPDTWNVSFLFEWVSPGNRIILNYGDQPDWYMVGMINHHDYSLYSQDSLDMWAFDKKFPRPTTYTFPSIDDLMKNIEGWKGKEGVVIYSNKDQSLHKVKCFEYLKKHRFKSEATLENTLELYFQMGKPSYNDFSTQLQTAFDYECFDMVRGYVSQICDAYKQVQQIVSGFQTFVNGTLKPLPNRKAQAEKVLASYAVTNRAAMVFALLDGKILSDDHMKKLFWQVLKK